MDDRRRAIRRVIRERAAMPFEYGVHDCAQLCLDVARALGREVEHPYRYGSAAQAAMIVHRAGGLRGLVSDVLGQEPVATPDDGDWVLVELDGLEALGVWAGGQAIVPHEVRGLVTVPAIVCAWRI